MQSAANGTGRCGVLLHVCLSACRLPILTEETFVLLVCCVCGALAAAYSAGALTDRAILAGREGGGFWRESGCNRRGKGLCTGTVAFCSIFVVIGYCWMSGASQALACGHVWGVQRCACVCGCMCTCTYTHTIQSTCVWRFLWGLLQQVSFRAFLAGRPFAAASFFFVRVADRCCCVGAARAHFASAGTHAAISVTRLLLLLLQQPASSVLGAIVQSGTQTTHGNTHITGIDTLTSSVFCTALTG